MKKRSQNDSFKFYELLFRSIILVLIGASIIALVLIHLNMFLSPKFEFDFSLKNIGGYLDIYKDYSSLFSATVAVIVAYLGLQSLKDKIRQDRFSEWKTVLDVRLIEIEKTDPLMRREFIKLRQNFFMDLYELNFNIKNKGQLKKVFDSNFGSLVDFFESMNENYMSVGGFYPDKSHSFAGQDFAFLFSGCIDKYYDNLYPDILELYRMKLPESRLIDAASYYSGINKHKTRVF